MKYHIVHVVMQCWHGYMLEVGLKWGKRTQGSLSEWKHRPGEQWVNMELQHLTFGGSGVDWLLLSK